MVVWRAIIIKVMPVFTWPESQRVYGKWTFGDSITHTYFDYWNGQQNVRYSQSFVYEQNIDQAQKDLNGVQVTYSISSTQAVTREGGFGSPHTYSASGVTKWRQVWGKGDTQWVTYAGAGKFSYRSYYGTDGAWKPAITVTFTSGVNIREYAIGKEKWPYETYSGKINSETYSGKQLANGYYTGIPTYSGTSIGTGYTIIDKTELKRTTGTFRGIIDLGSMSPYYRPETQPKNFVWMPATVHYYGEIRAIALLDKIGVGFYGYRDSNYYWMGARPILSLAGINSEATLDSVSETTTTIPVSFIKATFNEKVNGNTTYRVEPYIVGTYQYVVGDYTTTKITEYFSTGTNYRLPPIVDTRTATVYTYTNSVQKGDLYDGFAKVDYTRTGFSVSKNELYKTTYSDRPFVASGGGESGSYWENWGFNTHYRFDRSEFGRTMAKWPVNIGRLAQIYETSKAGYYYTDPKSMYKDPTDLSTYLKVNYYKCFDGTCVDIRHVANKAFFQTAKTANNSIAFHTYREPRNADKRLKGTDQLQSIFSYSTKTTNNMGGKAYSGHPSYSKGPFGDSMIYNGEATYKDQYSNIKSTTVYANDGQGLEGPAQAGIGYLSYNEYDDDGTPYPPLPFQQANLDIR